MKITKKFFKRLKLWLKKKYRKRIGIKFYNAMKQIGFGGTMPEYGNFKEFYDWNISNYIRVISGKVLTEYRILLTHKRTKINLIAELTYGSFFDHILSLNIYSRSIYEDYPNFNFNIFIDFPKKSKSNELLILLFDKLEDKFIKEEERLKNIIFEHYEIRKLNYYIEDLGNDITIGQIKEMLLHEHFMTKEQTPIKSNNCLDMHKLFELAMGYPVKRQY